MRGLDRRLGLQMAALLFGGGGLGLAANAARPDGVSLRDFEAPTSCSAEGYGAHGIPPASEVVELPPREASFLCGARGVVFADTRPLARFEEGHVADAVHLPCDASEEGAQAILTHLADATTVIVYGDSSDDGRAVAETLARRSSRRPRSSLRARLYVLTGGFGAWEKEGLACASGPSKGGATNLSSIAEKP